MALDKTEVQKVYVAYFNRPADPGGLAYWMSSDWNTVFGSFPVSIESQTLYSGATVADQITSIYNKLLGRAPDAEGLAYWVSEVNNPLSPVTAASAAKAIIDAALGSATDAANVQAKLIAANAFTDTLATKDVTTQNKYNQVSMQQEARDFLTGVNAYTTDTNQKIAVLMTDIANAPTPANPGQTYNYSDSASTKLVGTSGDDLFYIYDSNDNKNNIVYIAGGDGYDTIFSSDRAFRTNGVEKIVLTGGKDPLTINANKDTGEDAFEVYEKTMPQNNTVEYDATQFNSRIQFLGQRSKINFVVTGTSKNDRIDGGNGDDVIRGGNGNDSIYASEGRDVLTGGQGQDYFMYCYTPTGNSSDRIDPVAFSSLYSMDHITDLAIGTDIIYGEYYIGTSVTHIETPIDSLTDTAISNVLNDVNFHARGAATFTYGSRTFLALNDHLDGFQVENDAIIEITGYSGDLNLLYITN